MENVDRQIVKRDIYFLGCKHITAKQGANAGKDMFLVNLVEYDTDNLGAISYNVADPQFIFDQSVINQIETAGLHRLQKVDVKVEALTFGARARIVAITPTID